MVDWPPGSAAALPGRWQQREQSASAPCTTEAQQVKAISVRQWKFDTKWDQEQQPQYPGNDRPNPLTMMPPTPSENKLFIPDRLRQNDPALHETGHKTVKDSQGWLICVGCMCYSQTLPFNGPVGSNHEDKTIQGSFIQGSFVLRRKMESRIPKPTSGHLELARNSRSRIERTESR